MGILSRGQVNLANKTDEQINIIKNYFFSPIGNAYQISDRHYCDMVIEKKDEYDVREIACQKLAITDDEEILSSPIESLAFSYDGQYLYRNGNSSKVKYFCMFLGSKQIYAYTYLFDMTSKNFNETATEIFYDSIVAISTEEKVCESEVDLFAFLDERGKRTIHTLINIKIATTNGNFEFSVQKTPEVEKQLEKFRVLIRDLRKGKRKKED